MTEQEFKQTTLRVGKLKAHYGEANKSWEIVYMLTDDTSFVIAFLNQTKEGFDVRTVGLRPWNVKDVHPNSVFAFIKQAVDLLNPLLESLDS